MTDLKEEAGRLILETSKLAVEAIIGVLKKLQIDNNLHKTYTTQHLQDVQFLCQVIRPYSGHAARFPPDLAPHLQAADQALKGLEKLFNEAKDLQGWNPLTIVKKIWEAPEFKQKFDVQLEHLHTHWNEFNTTGRKSSMLMAWEEIFLRYPHAGLFWLTIARTETKITYDKFYDELIIACGGNRKKTGNYSSLFLKGYIYGYMCETKTNSESTTLITVHSFKTWIGTNSNNDDNDLELKDLVEKALVQMAIEGPEFDSPARRLYQRAKGLLNDAQTTKPPNRDKLEEAQKLFEEYRMNVEEKVPLVRDPKEDRHLYYLMEIERLLYPNLVNTTAGNAFQKWQKWSKDFGTKSPKQKAQAAAVNHYYQGEAYIRKAKIQLGEEVEDDKKAEETWSKLPRYKKTLMNAWTTEDITKWLEDLKYSEYIPIFTENHIDGQILMSISDEEFKTELKIEKLFHRRSLLNFIKAFSPQTQPLINTLKVDEDDVLWLLQSARAEFDVYKNVLQDPTDEKNKSTGSEKSRGKAIAVLGDKSDYYLTEIQRLEQRIAIQALTNRGSGSGVASSASPQKTT